MDPHTPRANIDFGTSWRDGYSPRVDININRPQPERALLVYSAARKPEIEYHNNRLRAKKSDSVIHEIPRILLPHEEKIRYLRKSGKLLQEFPQQACTKHKECREQQIINFFGGEHQVEEFRTKFRKMDNEVLFIYFQGWCVWPKQAKSRDCLQFYDEDGNLLEDRANRYPKTIQYHIQGTNGTLSLCKQGLMWLIGRGKTLVSNWTAQTYKCREMGNLMSQYENNKFKKEERLVTLVSKHIEKNYEIRKSHYVRNLVKSGNLSLRSKSGGNICHYTQIYRSMLKKEDPQAFDFMNYQVAYKKWERQGRSGQPPSKVYEKKPIVSLKYFLVIMKKKLKITIKEPTKDRCPICADINAQKSRDKKKEPHYERLLQWHLKAKRSQKSLLRTIESLVDPY